MSSFESILKNFWFEPVNENKYPKFGKEVEKTTYLLAKGVEVKVSLCILT